MTDAFTTDVLQDPVVKHMRTDFVQLRSDETVGHALDSILARQPEGRIIYFYVNDADGRLIGVVPTRRLLLSPRDRPLAAIMVAKVIAIPHSATVLDACEFFVLHKLLAFPIIDDARKMIGLVDVDLYTKELSDLDHRDDSENLFQLIGVHLSEAQQASPFVSFGKRFPWLLANIGGGILAAVLAGLYEHELEKAIALALFIPVVLALAESVCIQSVSLALQTQRPTWLVLARRLGAELCTGAILGLACGLVVGLAALAWIWQPRVALCVLGGIAAGVTGAALLGLAIPNLLRLMRRDPHVAAGPVALALTDMATLLIYLNLARWLI
jgi:magnesium transporter